MFTGIVQAVGEVEGVRPDGASLEVAIRAGAGFEDLDPGESIAVDGACLTVTSATRGTFRALASPETLTRTTLGEAAPGRAVNIERALRATDRLGGHFVLGHVDGTGRILARRPEGTGEGGALRLRFSTPVELAPMIVPKGSIAVDGVSLTVNVVAREAFEVTMIPFTASRTTLGRKPIGARVNLETDILAKHVLKILGALLPGGGGRGAGGPQSPPGGSIDLDFLARHGLLE